VSVPRPGSLVITKVLEGDPSQRGDIQIRVQCARLPGFPAGTFDQTQAIPAGVDPEPLVFSPIPAPADCTVTEPVTGDNDAVDVVTSVPVIVRVNPNEQLPLTLTNTYVPTDPDPVTGRLVVIKAISGPAAAFRGAVTLEVVCGDNTTVSITSPPDPPFIDVGPVPIGTSCTITEPVTGAIGGQVDVVGPTFDPAAVVTVDGPLVGATVGNSYHFPPVVLVKEFDGPAADQRGTVRMRLTCGAQTATITSPAGEVGPITATLAEVPPGTPCTVTELNNGATSGVAVATTFDPSQAITVGESRMVTATNTYTPILTGDLQLRSILTGPAEPQRGTVELTITCDSGRTVTLTIPAGTSPDLALVGGLPAGTRCTVQQVLDGDTPDILTSTTGAPTEPLEIVVDEAATVEVTNTYTAQVTPTTAPTSTTTPTPTTAPAPTTAPTPTPTTPPPTTPPPITPPTSAVQPSGGGSFPLTGTGVTMLVIPAIAALLLGATCAWAACRMREPPEANPPVGARAADPRGNSTPD
jgi:hypothetical protein